MTNFNQKDKAFILLYSTIFPPKTLRLTLQSRNIKKAQEKASRKKKQLSLTPLKRQQIGDTNRAGQRQDKQLFQGKRKSSRFLCCYKFCLVFAWNQSSLHVYLCAFLVLCIAGVYDRLITKYFSLGGMQWRRMKL